MWLKNSWKKIPPIPFIGVLPLMVHAEILNGQQDPKLYYLESSLLYHFLMVSRGYVQMA